MSEGLAQGPHVAARVGFEPVTQGTELKTEPPCPKKLAFQVQELRLNGIKIGNFSSI